MNDNAVHGILPVASLWRNIASGQRLVPRALQRLSLQVIRRGLPGAIILLGVGTALQSCAAGTNATPKLFAFCVGDGGGISPGTLAEEAGLLKGLGYHGIGKALWFGDELERNLQVLDRAGMPLYLLWTSLNLKPAQGPVYDPRTIPAIRKLEGNRPTLICCVMNGLSPGDTNGIPAATKALRELGDAAAAAGVRISVYNHVDSWAESLPFIIDVVKRVDHPRVGYNFNVCHWCRVERKKDYRPVLRSCPEKLFCVAICGADTKANAWTNGLIQPLDKGDFDNQALLAFINEIGYRGPVGLMCYGIPGPPRDYLSASMKTWLGWSN